MSDTDSRPITRMWIGPACGDPTAPTLADVEGPGWTDLTTYVKDVTIDGAGVSSTPIDLRAPLLAAAGATREIAVTITTRLPAWRRLFGRPLCVNRAEYRRRTRRRSRP